MSEAESRVELLEAGGIEPPSEDTSEKPSTRIGYRFKSRPQCRR